MGIDKEVGFWAKEYYDQVRNEPHGRFKSWEYCYDAFSVARDDSHVDLDFLCLHLAFYLASWGMYRGSSFLLQWDYRIHLGAIEEILKEKYNPLFAIECQELLRKENRDLLEELYLFLENYYAQIRTKTKNKDLKSDLSSTLITKILMGTLGCTPAYDTYFVAGVRQRQAASGLFSIRSVSQLASYYQKHEAQFEGVRQAMATDLLIYPQMKVLDMEFWQLGFNLTARK